MKEWMTWWTIKIGGRQGIKRMTALLFGLDFGMDLCYTWQLEGENHLSSSLFSLTSLRVSPSYLLQVFRYLPPGCCWSRWEVQGALLFSCQGLCGPRGPPAKRTGTVLLSCCIPANEGYGKQGVRQGGGSVSRRVELCLDFVYVQGVWLQRLPPLSSRLVPFCPVCDGAAGQANAPAWNPNPGARCVSPPSPVFYRSTACATHQYPLTYTLTHSTEHRGTPRYTLPLS